MAQSQPGPDDLLAQVQAAIRQNNVAEAVRCIQTAPRAGQLELLYTLSRGIDPEVSRINPSYTDPDFYAGRQQIRNFAANLSQTLDQARKPDGAFAARAALDLAQTLNRETDSLRASYLSDTTVARGLAGVGRTVRTLIQVLSTLASETPDGSAGHP